MTPHDITKKLIGEINPIGESDTDKERYENLQVMCRLVEHLLHDIDNVRSFNKNQPEYSKREAANYSDNFLMRIIKDFNPKRSEPVG